MTGSLDGISFLTLSITREAALLVVLLPFSAGRDGSEARRWCPASCDAEGNADAARAKGYETGDGRVRARQETRHDSQGIRGRSFVRGSCEGPGACRLRLRDAGPGRGRLDVENVGGNEGGASVGRRHDHPPDRGAPSPTTPPGPGAWHSWYGPTVHTTNPTSPPSASGRPSGPVLSSPSWPARHPSPEGHRWRRWAEAGLALEDAEHLGRPFCLLGWGGRW